MSTFENIIEALDRHRWRALAGLFLVGMGASCFVLRGTP